MFEGKHLLNSRMNPIVVIEPSECLVDEDIRIRIEGLRCYQDITIHAVFSKPDDVSHTFDSYAKYTADRNGNIDVASQASVGGSYTGIDPTGLFTSMKSTSPYRRLFIKDVEQPANVFFRIYNSHLSEDELRDATSNAITEASVRLWYKSPDVKRIPVDWKNVRGTLFIPSGRGRYPAVINIFGAVSHRILEHRASLFASKGYVAFALAYPYDYHGSYKKGGYVHDLEYYEEAKEFLNTRPEVIQNEIGIVGHSLGGTLALACVSCIPGFKCAVSVGGPIFPPRFPFRYKDRLWKATVRNFNLEYQENGDLIVKYNSDEMYADVDALGRSLIEFAKSDKPILYIFGHDDKLINVPKIVSFIENAAKEQQAMDNYKIAVYPGAGHILEPPNFPHLPRLKMTSQYIGLGGEPNKHGKAQKLAWEEIMIFLKKNLADTSSRL